MHEIPTQKLCELVNHHGATLSENAERCEFLMSKACGGDYKLEVFVLINAIREGVAQELLNPPPDLPNDVWFANLTQRLYDNQLAFLGLEKNIAEWAVQSWNMALSGLAIASATPPKSAPETATVTEIMTTSALSQKPAAKVTKHFKRLFYLNPLDHIRLLWWVLVMPQQLQAYRQTFGEEDENQIGKWLVSTLTWWPLLMPTLASGLELLLPSADNWPPDAYMLFSVLLVGCWLLTGRLGNEGMGSVMSNVAFGVVFSVVFGVTYAVAIVTAFIVVTGVMTDIAFGVAFVVAYVITFYVAYVVAIGVAFSVKDAVTNSLEIGTPQPLARFAFLLLVVTYLFLIWFCFLGGERVLIGH